MIYYDINLYNIAKNLLLETLEEDTNNNDLISQIIPNKKYEGYIVANSEGIFAGEILGIILEKEFQMRCYSLKDGEVFKKNEKIFSVEGNLKVILSIERSLLNIITLLCSVATTTRKFVEASKGKFKILDTRKTIPGLRFIEKYAVRVGGGINHRFGLYDMIMIKDNHISAFKGNITEIVKLAREKFPMYKVEVECDTMDQVKKAVEAGADIIMLDNMSVEEIKECAEYVKSKNSNIIVEASGNMTIEKVLELAEVEPKIDFISTSKITLGFETVDLSFVILS